MYRRITLVSIVLIAFTTVIASPAEARRRCRLLHRRECCRDTASQAYASKEGYGKLRDERDNVYATCGSVQCKGKVLTITCVGMGSDNAEARKRLCEYASRCCGDGGFVMGPITFGSSVATSGCSCSGGTEATTGTWFATRFYTSGTLDQRLAVGFAANSAMAVANATTAAMTHHMPATVIFDPAAAITWQKP